VRAAEDQFAKDYLNAVLVPVEESVAAPEPVDEPVQALEPAPVEALEPALALAEEQVPEPAPEPVPEPEPEQVPVPEERPRMTSIDDLRGSIVLVPEYASRSMWG
jgi:hypothetical protein